MRRNSGGAHGGAVPSQTMKLRVCLAAALCGMLAAPAGHAHADTPSFQAHATVKAKGPISSRGRLIAEGRRLNPATVSVRVTVTAAAKRTTRLTLRVSACSSRTRCSTAKTIRKTLRRGARTVRFAARVRSGDQARMVRVQLHAGGRRVASLTRALRRGRTVGRHRFEITSPVAVIGASSKPGEATFRGERIGARRIRGRITIHLTLSRRTSIRVNVTACPGEWSMPCHDGQVFTRQLNAGSHTLRIDVDHHARANVRTLNMHVTDALYGAGLATAAYIFP